MSCNLCVFTLNLPLSSAQSIFLLTTPDTSKSKLKSNIFSIVALNPLTEPKICCSFSKLPTTFSNFNNNAPSFQPPLTTVPLAFPCVIVSPSKKLTFLNTGSKEARSFVLITLPKALFPSKVPPVVPRPTIG